VVLPAGVAVEPRVPVGVKEAVGLAAEAKVGVWVGEGLLEAIGDELGPGSGVAAVGVGSGVLSSDAVGVDELMG
jgi:hypothetical protein